MQEVLEARGRRVIPGATISALRRYASERAPIVVATARARRFIKGRAYAQLPKIIERSAPEVGPLIEALAKNVLSNVRYHMQKGISADTLLANSHNEEHASLLGLAQSAFAIRILLDAGANPNARSSVMMLNPLTAVIKSMPSRDRVEAIDILLQAGADPNGTTGVGAGPLDAALAKPDIAAVMLLIDAGARVDRFAVLSMIQAHNERAHRAAGDPEQLKVYQQSAKQMVDLVVAGSKDHELTRILKDREVSRLLRLTPEIEALFAAHVTLPPSKPTSTPTPR
jgi:hypothetical protein